MATINFIGDRDPFDEARELCLLIDTFHRSGAQVTVNTRYTREQLEEGIIPGALWVRTAMSKADQVITRDVE